MNLGAIFDTTISLSKHITGMPRAASNHHRAIGRIRKYLDRQAPLIHNDRRWCPEAPHLHNNGRWWPEAPFIHNDRRWWLEVPHLHNDRRWWPEAPLIHNDRAYGGLRPHSYIILDMMA